MRGSIGWGRWCLPSFNKHCDQLLKGALADMDNHLCDGKTVRKPPTVPREELCPWSNPTLLVMLDTYGF